MLRYANQALTSKQDQLIKEQDQIIQKIKEKETQKWETLKDEVRQILNDLKQKTQVSNPEIAQIKYQLNQTIEENHAYRITDPLKVGDLVFIIPYQQTGTIKSVDKDQYRVIFGKFDLSFKAEDLKLETKKETKEPKNKIKYESKGSTPTKKASFELDLRGYRFDEVKDALDQAIDSAMLSGLSQIRIIHGFGTGAVRKAVYDYIKSSPFIKEHRFGGEGEGLNGVTIITLT